MTSPANKNTPAGETETFSIAQSRTLAHPTTDVETLFHLLKGCMGAGILAMPRGFYNAGYTFGMIATCVVSVICTYCMHILVKSAHVLYRRHQIPALTYPDLVRTCFDNGPERCRKYSYAATWGIKLFLCADMLGCCVVYSLLAAGVIQQLVQYHTDIRWDVRVYIAILWIPFVIQNMIRNLKYLVPFSVIADLCITIGVIITFYYCTQDIESPSNRSQVAPFERMPLFFGLVIFALECVGVIMSLENNMKTPEHMIGCVSVLNIGMATTTFMYVFLGSFGYLKYGDHTQGNISLNLPSTDPLAESVKVMIGIAVFFTHALSFYPPFEIIWRTLGEKFSDEKRLRAEYVTRIILVTLTSLLGIAIPTLAPVISLVGCTCLSFMGLIYPAVVETLTYWDDPASGRFWLLLKNGVIAVFGLFGFCIGSYVSILDIIDEYVNKSTSDAPEARARSFT